MSSENERSLRDELNEAATEVFDRARDEAGRFAKSEPMVAEEPVVEASVDTTVTPAATPVPEEDPFPQSWKQDYKQHWNAVPKELRSYIRQHEESTRKAMTAQDEDRLFGKGLREAFNPYQALLQSENIAPVQAIQVLLNQHYIMRMGTPEQKRSMLLNAAKHFNIDLNEPAGTQTWVDPQVQQLQQQLQELNQWKSSYEQQVQQQEKASIEGQIASFGADPKHTHFANPQVQALMGNLLMNGAPSMEEAYQQAIWALPELRSTLLTEHQAQEEAKRAAETKVKADAARKASGSVRGSSAGMGSAVVAAPKGSLREELRAQLAAAKNRI